MLKVRSIMEVEVNGKKYEFSCDPDSQLPDVINAHSQVGSFLKGKYQEYLETQKPKEESAPEAVKAE